MSKQREGRQGQIIVMVTLVLFAMVGMLGLAVDLGWAYFIKKSEQAAADAAALAAAREALRHMSAGGVFSCGGGIGCADPTPYTCPATPTNPPSDSFDSGCLYAQRNGFITGGNGGRQTVTLMANTTTPAPTAQGVVVDYWVTARVTESIPQLFSAILGNTVGMTSARATAAITDSVIPGSLILLNRENDCIKMEGGGKATCGVDLLVSANDNCPSGVPASWCFLPGGKMPALQVDGGTIMASRKNGTQADGRYAGENTGGGTVWSDYTHIRPDGWYMNQGSAQWIQTPEKQTSSSQKDPFWKKGQPPVNMTVAPPAAFPNGVPDGVIRGSSDPSQPTLLYPGAYFTSVQDRQTGAWIATGDPILMTGAIRFVNSGGGVTGFSDFVFYGGLRLGQQGAGETIVEFSPGRYVLAGAKPKSNGAPGVLMDFTTNATVREPAGAGDAGTLFIFTDPSYEAWDPNNGLTRLNHPALVTQTRVDQQLQFGISGFQAGNNQDLIVQLDGISRHSNALPTDLQQWMNPDPLPPFLMWQDKRNSVVQYFKNPNDPMQGEADCVGNDDPCVNSGLRDAASPELFFKASPGSTLHGIIYQPRGAWTTMLGGSAYAGPLQIISGAFKVQGNANLNLGVIADPIKKKVAALIE